MLTGGWSRDCEHFTFFLTFFLTFHYPLSPPSKTPNGVTDKPRFQKVRELAAYLCTFCGWFLSSFLFFLRLFVCLFLANARCVERIMHDAHLNSRHTPQCRSYTAHSSDRQSKTICGPSPSRPTANKSTLDLFVTFLTCYTPSPTRPTANESALDSFQFCGPSPTRPTANESTLDSFVIFLTRYTPSPTRPTANEVKRGLVCCDSRTLHPTLLHPLARQQTSRTWTRLPRFPHATPHKQSL
ncbi:hypothetical protein GGU11DRAFT_385060 [Lentinula aff. detonsa]|nr:hypothetical protein GGU11DRAFT_385060 [Lentinula aff. detonsa]